MVHPKTLQCPLCDDPDCTVVLTLRLSPEVVPSEGEAWVGDRLSGGSVCRRRPTESLRDFAFCLAEWGANSPALASVHEPLQETPA